MAEQNLDIEELRRTVANLVEEDPESIENDANLFTLGLDSIALMQLIGSWRQVGIEVNFAELAESPTIGAWSKMISTPEPTVEVDTRIDTAYSTDAEFPLAVMQHAYWIGREEGQQLGGVAAHLYTEFDGMGVDPKRLHIAIERLITRHDMLRAQFTEDGQQRIGTASGWRGLTVHDLSGLDDGQLTTRLRSIRETLSHQMLDIKHGEVFSTALSLLSGGRTRFHIDVDMLSADAVSYRILLADLAQFYEQPDVEIPAVNYSYREYRAARPESRREATLRAAQWWRNRLPDLPGAPELPLVTGPNVGHDSSPARVTRRYFTMSPREHALLIEFSRRRGLTPAMVMATAFGEVIGAWSAQPRFLLNVPLFDREPVHPDVSKLVGDFSGSVLLEIDLTEPVEFVERVRRVQSRMHTDAAYADYSGVEVLRDLRRSGDQVLAPVVFTSALSLGELFHPAVWRHFGDPVWIISQGPQVLLDAQITEVSGGLLVNWDVREEKFAEGVVDVMFAAFQQLVYRLLENGTAWDTPVGDLLPMQQRVMRAQINDTAGPRSDRLLHESFFTHAGERPERVAVTWGKDKWLSYGELAQRAQCVAGLLRSHGVDSGDFVAVTLPKGVDQVVAVLGVLAAGATYVPVGIDQPVMRRTQIYKCAGVRVVLTDGESSKLTAPSNVIAVDIATAAEMEPVEPVLEISDESVAYIIFTSGSTGEPKGVEVPHRAVMNTIEAVNKTFLINEGDRTLALSALDFDLSAYDIFAFLSYGGSVVLIDEAARRNAWCWIKLIRRWKVTVLSCVPAFLDMLLTAGANERVSKEVELNEGLGASLRLVMLGGDWVGTDLPVRLWEQVAGCRFAALGGMTEAAIHSTVYEITVTPPTYWRAIPYGRPLRNMRCRVVDSQGRDCPDWVPGELWVGGPGVALGYRNDPERTAVRFVIHDGLRWYRTGDRARYWPDGTLEFLGRTDHQVKIRGHRIELGEIEAVLRAHQKVGYAVAVVVGEQTRQLAAAVTASDRLPASSVEPEDLLRWTADRLPDYMVPERIITLDKPPITRNGKIDRDEIRRLLTIGSVVQMKFQPVCGAIEDAVARVWSDLLGIERVGREDSFFALGGDSLSATRAISRLRAIDLGDVVAGSHREITIVDLYRHPTVASLAARLGSTTEESDELNRVAARARRQRQVRQSRMSGPLRRETNHRG